MRWGSKYQSEKCSQCKFRSNDPAINDCDYAFIEGHSRGCPGGDDCVKFEKGPRISKRSELPVPMRSEESMSDKEFQRYDYRKHQRFFGYKGGLHQYYENKK